MLDYAVKIEPFKQDSLQVVWIFDNYLCPPYLVDRDDLFSISENEIRPSLRKLVTLATKNQLSEADHVLRELARGGHRLYKTFFNAKGGAASQEVVEKIRDNVYVKGQRGRLNIGFFVAPRIYIPWALMFEDLEPKIHCEGIAAYEACWGLKHGIATIYDCLASPLELSPRYDAGTFDTLCAADGSVIAKATSNLDPLSSEASLFGWLEQKYGPPVVTSQSLLLEWKSRRNRLGLLYFYCHANQTNIGFSERDVLDTIDFKTDYKKSENAPRCLVFLNGCHTAAGEERGGFLEATGREGFCGFVGAETTLPFMFAHRFGAALISALYRGSPLVEIVSDLRRRHWPLSLVYGLYAYPFLQITPDANSAIPHVVPTGNYSSSAPGTDLL